MELKNFRQRKENDKIIVTFQIDFQQDSQHSLYHIIKNALSNVRISEYNQNISRLTFKVGLLKGQQQFVYLLTFVSQLSLLFSSHIPIQVDQTIEFELEIEKLDRISAFKNITDTIIFNNFRRSYDLSLLSDLHQLRTLSLINCQISKIPNIPVLSLENLYISNNNIDDLSPIAKLTNLIKLDASANQILNLQPISKLINLTHLQVRNNNISDVYCLRSIKTLKYLDISQNSQVDIWGLQFLKKLICLEVYNCNIADLSPIEGLKQLKTLGINNDLIQSSEIFAIKQQIPNLTINYGHNNVIQRKHNLRQLGQYNQCQRCEHQQKFWFRPLLADANGNSVQFQENVSYNQSSNIKLRQFAIYNPRTQLYSIKTSIRVKQFRINFEVIKERTVQKLNGIANGFFQIIDRFSQPDDETFLQ
ncbi:leucine-rich_repeat domain-containing protein [Hexamita inflata]|uniref:Leucine-rich repeat domain-containing protein n=1 Tax=Hexamita inflata TaxID=28002 RepID=A0AA86PNJ2_9EUKA|nr:leucine-rich repeat domain-containing protein [Hexamita inflata]